MSCIKLGVYCGLEFYFLNFCLRLCIILYGSINYWFELFVEEYILYVGEFCFERLSSEKKVWIRFCDWIGVEKK